MPPDTPITTSPTSPTGPADPSPLDPSTGLLMLVRRGLDLAQATFRALVEAVSNPGRPVRLPAAPDGLPPVVLPVLTVVDLQTVVSVVDADPARGDGLASAIGRVTGAPITSDHRTADVVLVADPTAFTPDLVWMLRTGSSLAPEQGAKVFVACAGITAGGDGDPADPDSTHVAVSGPGAMDGRRLRFDGVDPGALTVVDRVNAGYPAGVDVFVIDANGFVVGLPRSNRLRAGGDR
jgi:alpha-D-ribose 1-methylphosphonate 5-triphosphate synthase subunit PhnH